MNQTNDFCTIPAPDTHDASGAADAIQPFRLVRAQHIRHAQAGSSNAWEITFHLPHMPAHAGIRPGMQIALLPVNAQARVAEALRHLRDVPNMPIMHNVPMQSGQAAKTQALTAEQMLAHCVDMTRPTPHLCALVGAAQSPEPVEVFLAQHTGRISFSELVAHQPALANRKYTPSRVDISRNEISIMLSELWHGAQAGSSTQHLRALMANSAVPLHGFMDLRRHKLPYDMAAASGAPMVLLSTGVGIAPHLSFLRQTDAPNVACMISGGRNIDDAIMHGWLQQKLGDRYHYAASKNGHYVQDLVRSNAAIIWPALQAGGHVFMCGLAAMENAVLDALADMAQQQGVPDGRAFVAQRNDAKTLHASTSAPDRFYGEKCARDWAKRSAAK